MTGDDIMMEIIRIRFEHVSGKIWLLILNYSMTFVPGSVHCSSALCLFLVYTNAYFSCGKGC